MPETEDKALIASSEFDASNFIKGIDTMTAGLDKLSKREAEIVAELKKIDAALKANRQEYKLAADQIKALDKSSTTYKDDLAKLTAEKKRLSTQQKEFTAAIKVEKDALVGVQSSANTYKKSIENLTNSLKLASNQGKNIRFFDVVDLQKQIGVITQSASKIQTILKGKISTTEMDQFLKSLDSANNEFAEFAKIIAFVKTKLDTLDPESAEFAELNEIVQKGEQVLQAYGDAVEDTGKKTLSLRGRLIAMRTELVNLEEQGKENTKEFEDLQIAAGKLQDQVEDAQQRIKILASDTKSLDFGIGAIRGVASAYGVAEGAAALFGLKSEDVAKSLQRLNAIMLILNGLQEIQTLLQKQSVVAVVGQEIATKAAAVAQRIYAVAVGTSTGAMKAFRVAMLATGIGAFIFLLTQASKVMDLFGSQTQGTKEEIEEFNLSLEQSNRALTNAARDVQFRNNLAIEAAKQRGATEAEISDLVVTGLRKEAVANREVAKQKVKDVTDAVARFTQGAVIIDPESVDSLKDAREALDQVERAQLRISRLPGVTDTVTEGISAAVDAAKDIVATFEAATDADRRATEEIANFQTKRADDARKNAEKNADNFRAYLEKLAELERELRDKQLAAQPQDAARIREGFSNSIADLTADIDKDPRINKQQGKVLKTLLGKINKVDIAAALKEFNDQVAAAQKEFDQKQFDLQVQNGRERAELIREQLVRDAEIVRIEAETQGNILRRERQEIIDSINQTRDEGLISPEAAQINVDRIAVIYEQLLENLAAQTTRKQEEITARAFQAAQEQTQDIFANVQLLVSETATAETIEAARAFEAGEINYKQYQEELTAIAERETDRRIATAIREAEALLKSVQTRIPTEQDPERLKDLQDQERELRNRIAGLKKEQSDTSVAGIKKEQDELLARIQLVATYAQAIGGITQQIVGFWAQANQAEQEQLERSIALQEKRVEAATRIAERGNSEYLRLEEDRLQELQTKHENAARRQLAINAVMQTSQALTAFITALAQGIALTGPIGGIAVAAAVIAAIASGYAIVQSLQQPQRLKKGTKEVRRERGEAPGIDTVPAMLTEGEAVLPVNINKQYKTTIDAIFDKKIPAGVINNFVNTYQGGTKVLPRVDYERMGEATDIRVAYDGQLLSATRDQTRRLQEQTEALERVEKQLKNMGVSVNVDRNGLAVSVLRAVEQLRIDRKT